MDRNDKIPQLYGYAVCLISVIVILFSSGRIVNAMFDLADPIRSERGGWGEGGLPVSSFSAYMRAHNNRQGSQMRPAPGPQTPPSPALVPDTELRQLYNDDREEHIGAVRYRSMRSLMTGLLMILLAGTLFLVHWKWLRRQAAATV